MQRNHFYGIVLMILLIASFLRLWNLEHNPAWYTDEGTHIEIARYLMQGKVQYLGITDSYLIAARLPLFEHVLSLWFRGVGVSMLMLRILTSLIGVISTALVYRVVATASHDSRLGLLTSALFAIFPQAIIYSRFGFSYNLLSLLVLVGLWGLVRYWQSKHLRYLYWGCLCFGLGTVTDFIMLSFLPSVLLLILVIRSRHIIAGIILVLPFMLYALAELVVHPDIFMYDLMYTLARSNNLPLTTQLDNLIQNVKVLLTNSWWIGFGALGLLWIQPRWFRWMMILFVIPPFIISGRTVALYNLSAYYMIPFLPFFCIGLSALLIHGSCQLQQIIPAFAPYLKRVTWSLIGAIIVFSGVTVLSDVRKSFNIGIEHFLINPSEAYQIQNSLIDYAKHNTLIIASPTLAWMFDSNVTDYQLSSLTYQQNGVHFPAELYPERFAFDVNYQRADIVIVDTLWRDWGAVHMPAVADMLTHIQQWNLIFETDTIQVYRKPDT